MRGKAFAELVHLILVTEAKFSIEETAKAMGLSYDTFYARLCGRVTFVPEEIQSLIKVVPDPRIANACLEGTGFIAVERANPKVAPAETIMRGMHRIILESSEILREVEIALDDGKLSHIDKRKIAKEIDDAERALASLRARLDES